jgi:hypothetical protein
MVSNDCYHPDVGKYLCSCWSFSYFSVTHNFACFRLGMLLLTRMKGNGKDIVRAVLATQLLGCIFGLLETVLVCFMESVSYLFSFRGGASSHPIVSAGRQVVLIS